MIEDVKKELQLLANPQKAQILQRFFKTGPNQYGYGDLFLGITVPQIRQLVQKYQQMDLKELQVLIQDPYHEARLLVLLILVKQYQKNLNSRQAIFDLYLQSTKYINNWDLVDLTAEHIIGRHLDNQPKDLLLKLAHSHDLWEKRIAMLATFYYIKQKQPDLTLEIAEILLNDQHDLIHKAVGWMLREVGKRCDQDIEEEFLQKHYQTMPRTALRYAIERFDPQTRAFYMQKPVN